MSSKQIAKVIEKERKEAILKDYFDIQTKIARLAKNKESEKIINEYNAEKMKKAREARSVNKKT